MAKTRLALAAALMIAGAATAACDSSGGSGQKTGGEVKEAVGKITGDDSLKREGKKDQVVGGVKETVGDAKEAVKDATR